MKNNDRFNIPLALLISLLLHILIFVLLNLMNTFTVSAAAAEADDAPQPLVFELEPPPQEAPASSPPAKEQPRAQEQVPDKYFRIEENPNANETTPENADVLAEKSSVSAAPAPGEQSVTPPGTERSILPLNEQNKNPAEKEPEAVKDLGIKLSELEGDAVVRTGQVNREFSKELLTRSAGEKKQNKTDNITPENEQSGSRLLQEFSGDLIGDVALSTYAWKWAPWVLAMKEKFYRNLYVPPAYGMGLIDGQTEVWLKIDRRGKLVDHKLLDSRGHQTLKESTINAFLASVPWRALPADFPDEFLELRVRVIYPNLKEYFEKLQQSRQ